MRRVRASATPRRDLNRGPGNRCSPDEQGKAQSGGTLRLTTTTRRSAESVEERRNGDRAAPTISRARPRPRNSGADRDEIPPDAHHEQQRSTADEFFRIADLSSRRARSRRPNPVAPSPRRNAARPVSRPKSRTEHRGRAVEGGHDVRATPSPRGGAAGRVGRARRERRCRCAEGTMTTIFTRIAARFRGHVRWRDETASFCRQPMGTATPSWCRSPS